MKEWVRMPSFWLRDEDDPPLAQLRWRGDEKSDGIAALMLYVVLVQYANSEATAEFPEIGSVQLSYERLSEITGLSRAKIAGGLKVLKGLGSIEIRSVGRSNVYRIIRFGEPAGWAKLPAKGLYTKDLKQVHAFQRFTLRSKVELNALKLYLIIIALRNNSTNYAVASYETMCSYTGMLRNDIRSALSFLVTLGLIQVDQDVSHVNQFSTVNMYRPCYVDRYKHQGTTGRGLAEAQFGS